MTLTTEQLASYRAELEEKRGDLAAVEAGAQVMQPGSDPTEVKKKFTNMLRERIAFLEAAIADAEGA